MGATYWPERRGMGCRVDEERHEVSMDSNKHRWEHRLGQRKTQGEEALTKVSQSWRDPLVTWTYQEYSGRAVDSAVGRNKREESG